MKKRLTILFIMMTAAMVISSCEVALLDNGKITPTDVFEDLWTQIDEKYPHFEGKGIDWDAIHTKYSKQIDNRMNSQMLFDKLAAMLGEIKDGHVNLISPFDASHSPEMYQTLLGKPNFNETTIYKSYLSFGYHTKGGILHNSIKNGHVGYLYYNSWMTTLTTGDLSYIFNLYQNTEGLILDLRKNTGGALLNLRTLLEAIPSNGQLLYTEIMKSGPGHEDFGEPVASYAPKNGSVIWKKPIIVLVGPNSFSCSSLAALCLKSYDTVTVIGDTTGGGTSVVYTFGLVNGWEFRTPMSRTFAPDGSNYENGVPPDISVNFDPFLASTGIDSVIEYACSLIQK